MGAEASFDPLAIATRLRAARDGMTWSDRQRAARQAVAAVAADGPGEALFAVLCLLAEDPKWEVRREIASGLELLPEDRYEPLARGLLADRNRYVRTAAEHARDRRAADRTLADRRQRSDDIVRQQFAALAERHGPKVAEHAMRCTLAMYDLLVGSSVHEIRHVVIPLKSATRHLAAGLGDPAEAKRRLAAMIDWIGTLEQLLDDMRGYTQVGQQERTRERLSDLVDHATLLARAWFAGKDLDITRIRIDVQVPDGIVVPVVRHQVIMALKNVIKNAIDAFATGPTAFCPGTVSIRGGLREGMAEVRVTDTGMGLQPFELAELQRFVPGHSSKPHGTGFGLPTAHRRITEHGGDLTIDSVADQGTAVSITLPLHAEGT